MKAIHGGDVDAAARRLGRPRHELLDLSANINPAGPPEGVRAELRASARRGRDLERYPDPTYTALRAALARAAGVDVATIAVGNGTTALIEAAVRTLRPACCVLPVPSFSEYRKVLRHERVAVRTFRLAPPDFAIDPERLAAFVRRCGADLVILANPNNPTGALLARAALARFLAQLPAGTHAIVDEAFIDYAPEESLIGARPARNLIVLRSLTKFYALPGVRAGYAVAAPALAARVAAVLPSWPIGTLDARLAAAAPGDAAYDARTRRANARERELLAADLHARGIATAPAAANFLLCDVATRWSGTSSALAEKLAGAAGVLVRACDDQPVLKAGCWIRIAVRTRRESKRLFAALDAALEGGLGRAARRTGSSSC